MTFKEFLDKTYDYLKEHDCWVTESYKNVEEHGQHALERQLNKGTRYETHMTFSTTWSMGGTSGNCWNEDKSVVDPEMEPEEPKELDLILECVVPNLTFLQHKALLREVLLREERRHGDYYGGSTTEGHKGFDIITLFEALQKRGLV